MRRSAKAFALLSTLCAASIVLVAQGGAGYGRGEVAVRQDQVDALIRAYRVRGHMIAKVDPLGTAD